MGLVAFITTFLLLIGTFIYLGKGKRLINPLFLFLALWSVILFFSILQLYNIDPASDEAYLALLLMVISFTCGYMFYDVYKKKKEKSNEAFTIKERKEESEEKQLGFKSLRIKIYIGMCLLLIVFNIIDCILVIKYTSEGTPAWQVRNWSLEPFGSSNPILDRRSFLENVLRNIILAPMATLIPPVTAYFMFKSKDKKFKITLLVISLVVLFSSSFAGGGGRIGFILYFGCFLLAALTLGKYKKGTKKEHATSQKKNVKPLVTMGIAGATIIALLTTFRTGAGNMFKQTYTYFALPPTLLTKWMPIIDNSQKTYGMTTLFGVHSYVFRTLDTLGADQIVPDVYKESSQHVLDAEKFLKVGYGVANAFVTPVYYFLYDGGLLFVFFASLLFGAICSKIFSLYVRKRNIIRFLFYILVMEGIAISFMRIQTVIPSYVLSFVYVILFFGFYNKKSVLAHEG